MYINECCRHSLSLFQSYFCVYVSVCARNSPIAVSCFETIFLARYTGKTFAHDEGKKSNDDCAEKRYKICIEREKTN